MCSQEADPSRRVWLLPCIPHTGPSELPTYVTTDRSEGEDADVAHHLAFFRARQIIEHKKANRQRCLEATQRGDLLAAEKSVYNSTLCKQMAKEKEDGRVTFSKLVTKYSNPIVFTMGSMIAVAPFIALMILSHLKLFKGSERSVHCLLHT